MDTKVKTRIQVDSFNREQGKEPIKVTYRLIHAGDTWKVYDIIIEGVSLLKGFQAQFETDIQQQGLSALISRLRTSIMKSHSVEALHK